MKGAGFPTYKTFEGYEYSHIQFPPLFSREELESCQSLSSPSSRAKRSKVEKSPQH